MTFARIENGKVVEYPVYEGEIKLRYPNVSFPEQFEAPDGYEIVESAPTPQISYKQNLSLGDPERVGGVLKEVWVVSEASPEEISFREQSAIESNKALRNTKLDNTDWTQLADVPLTADCKTAFAAYRQALRDLDMLNPTWPEAPAEDWVA